MTVHVDNNEMNLLNGYRSVLTSKEDPYTIPNNLPVDDRSEEIVLRRQLAEANKALEVAQARVTRLTMELAEVNKTISDRDATIEAKNKQIESVVGELNAVKNSVAPHKVTFPNTAEDLIDINQLYTPGLTSNEEMHIHHSYPSVKDMLGDKYGYEDISRGCKVDVLDLLYKCPKVSLGNTQPALNKVIADSIRDMSSHTQRVKKRQRQQVLNNTFTINKSSSYIDGDDVNIYVRRSDSVVGDSNHLQSSIVGVQNRSLYNIRLTDKPDYRNAIPSSSIYPLDNAVYNMFFDGFEINFNKIENKTFIAEIVTMTPKELMDWHGGLPIEFARRSLHNDVKRMDGIDLESTQTRYDVLVITILDIDNMYHGRTHGLHSWKIDGIDLVGDEDSKVTSPKTEMHIDLQHPIDSMPYVLYEHTGGTPTTRHSKESLSATERRVVIKHITWTLLPKDRYCTSTVVSKVVLLASDLDYISSLSEYGLSPEEAQASNLPSKSKLRADNIKLEREAQHDRDSSKSSDTTLNERISDLSRELKCAKVLIGSNAKKIKKLKSSKEGLKKQIRSDAKSARKDRKARVLNAKNKVDKEVSKIFKDDIVQLKHDHKHEVNQMKQDVIMMKHEYKTHLTSLTNKLKDKVRIEDKEISSDRNKSVIATVIVISTVVLVAAIANGLIPGGIILPILGWFTKPAIGTMLG